MSASYDFPSEQVIGVSAEISVKFGEFQLLVCSCSLIRSCKLLEVSLA